MRLFRRALFAQPGSVSAGHTLADLRKRLPNVVEVGGVESPSVKIVDPGQKGFPLVNAPF